MLSYLIVTPENTFINYILFPFYRLEIWYTGKLILNNRGGISYLGYITPKMILFLLAISFARLNFPLI